LWQAFLPGARWFQAKGLAARVREITPLPWYTDSGDVWVRSEIAAVDTAAGPESYHLLVGYLPVEAAEPAALVGRTTLPGRGEVAVVDAPLSPTAMAACLRGLAEAPTPRVVWFERPPDPGAPTAVYNREQSHTNVCVGQTALLKLFRRLPGARSLEAELLRTLRGTGLTPNLIGTLSSPETGFDLGLICERVVDAVDGWDLATAAGAAGESVESEMAALGHTLRRLHFALAEAYGVSHLDPLAITRLMTDRLDAAAAWIEDLRPWRDALAAAYGGLGVTPVTAQRLHGDFHLGQGLLSARGWTLIDLEGEPLKTWTERAAFDVVWRDVAGLTRSLDYARSRLPDPDGPAARQWHAAARAAFLHGYRGDDSPPPALLRAYEVDRAVYELQYELRNRPDWAVIPRRALAEAAARPRS
jgi:maltokinase